MATRYGICTIAALLGKIEQFDPDQEDWPKYIERLEQFFKANDLTGEDKATKRQATFLTVIGPARYRLLRSLLLPEMPSSKMFKQLLAKLTEHYNPEPSEVMQRFRSRKPGESVAAYIANLRRIAQYCNFGTTLDKTLRDRLLWGVNDNHAHSQEAATRERQRPYFRACQVPRSFYRDGGWCLREMRASQKESSPCSTGVSGKTEPVHN